MATVRKRKWTYKGRTKEAWVVNYFDGNGKRILETFALKRKADDRLEEITQELRQGTHVPKAKGATVAEAAEVWHTARTVEELERSTLDQYRQHIDLHIVPFIGNIKIADLTIPGVRNFQDRLRQAGRSADMVRRVVVSLGSILDEAVEAGLAGRNVTREMSRRRKRGRTRAAEKRKEKKLEVGVDIPTPDEVRAIIAGVQGKWRPLIITAIFTGMRASELRGLRWIDVDFKEGVIRVRQRADRYQDIGATKSASSQRTIPAPPIVINTLKAWRLDCPRHGKRKDHPGELRLVFPSGAGNVEYHGNIIKRGLIPSLIGAGVCVEETATGEDGKAVIVKRAKYTGLHALRHFYASWCINRQADGGLELPPKMVQERMGHSSIVVTMDRYSHLFPVKNDAELMAAAERSLVAV